jgi:hypothetical protein
VRKQEIVGVNRNDLDDIKEFDGMQALFANLGMFLLAGSTWLGLEKVLEQEVFHWTPLLAVCATASAVGIFFFAVSLTSVAPITSKHTNRNAALKRVPRPVGQPRYQQRKETTK